ncbi:MAG: bifunctional nuclease family protein [Thermoprotei archaeon]|nr:MAG: bifunctional nuclease family protein [Thermoprotei archaeon]RLF16725.1 MAG: bifunctional nuclease family protein [Thermoprotei archaeon]
MTNLIEVKVFDVVVAKTPYGLTSAVLLEESDGRIMPILVDPYQASSIRAAMEGEVGEVENTHDLLMKVMKEAAVTLKKATIYALVDDRFQANITIESNGAERELESRASDAIALALRARVPIYVAEDVFDKASISREELTRGEPSEEM